MIPVNIKILPNGKGLKLPEYETRNSAGMDLMLVNAGWCQQGFLWLWAPGLRHKFVRVLV